jgi:hypothetical protein
MTATTLLSDNGASSGTSGYKLTGGNDGTLQLQTTTSGGTATTAMTIDTSQKVTFANPIQGGSITSGTAVASTSGTSIDFTGIPSWVKRITVMFNGVSTSGTNNWLLQLGSGSVTSSGYASQSAYAGATNAAGGVSSTSGFIVFSGNSANLVYGHVVFTLLNSNLWVGSHALGLNASGTIYNLAGGGAVTLSSTLDRLRITTVNGTDTFDAGSVNILYEG